MNGTLRKRGFVVNGEFADMIALSLFSGIGGLDVAAVSAGFKIAAQVEIDPYCRAILKKHAARWWKDARQFGDIRAVTGAEIGKVDVLFGGFPCQDISVAGKQAGIRNGERSGLFFELLRLVRELRPRAIILENVANITNSGLDIVSGTLVEIGYDCIWQTVRAADAGAPHQRERWFCLGILGDANGAGQQKSGRRESVQAQQSVAERTNLGNASGIRCKARQAAAARRANHHKKRHGAAKEPRRHAKQSRAMRTSRRRIKSGLGRTADGLSGRLDFPGFPARPNEAQYGYEPPRISCKKEQVKRTARIKALGNAVVPQQAFPFFEAVYRFLKSEVI